MKTGRRVWRCELSTVDTAFLLAGVLVAAAYFASETADEREIRTLADELYRRHRLAVGPGRRGDGHAWMETGERLLAVPVARL